jgi:hypothetical protein
MTEHISTLAKRLAELSRCQAQSNVEPIIEIIRVLPEELNKLQPENFAPDAQTEFLFVRERIRGLRGKTTWASSDFPRIADTAARLVTVLEKYEGPDKRAPSSVNIENFQGILGNVIHSTVEQNLTINVATGDFQSLRKGLQRVGLTNVEIDELEKAVNSDPPPQSRDRFGPAVSAWLGTTLQKAAQGAYELTIATAGGVLAELLMKYYGVV